VLQVSAWCFVFGRNSIKLWKAASAASLIAATTLACLSFGIEQGAFLTLVLVGPIVFINIVGKRTAKE
jgi:hypothetical protein